MKLLLDTHILIWALNGDPHLPRKAREMILYPGNTLYYSCVSLWEIAVKHAIHPENVSFSAEILSGFCREAGFLPLEVKEKHIFALETLVRQDDAPKHSDPFDRMLIAQAKAEGMTLLTHDGLLAGYGEKCVIVC
ncbi:MAG: type II toxin-antitoxin system VapC family toxin [Lachnospiraceae bacterium]|nr:type II toxin-antitoxin system VapC family toxin [Lachnospiraceae bacterium]